MLVANRADPSGGAPLKDLPGQGGRFDVVARFVNAALLTSHGIREDATVVVWFAKGEPEPVAVRIRGRDAVGLRPDERSTAARLNKVLSKTGMPVWQDVGDGVELRTLPFDELVEELVDPVWVLLEDGDAIEASTPVGGSFVVGDQDDFTEEQRGVLEAHSKGGVSVGPISLQADQVATVVNNVLDRA